VENGPGRGENLWGKTVPEALLQFGKVQSELVFSNSNLHAFTNRSIMALFSAAI
jgi:hypothetical protein